MSELAILFGRPYRAPEGEDRFELEALAAEELGIESYSLPLDPVVNGEPARALRHLPRPSDRRWLYRGWMLNEEEYTGLYETMSDRGEEMVVDRLSVGWTSRDRGTRRPAMILFNPADWLRQQ